MSSDCGARLGKCSEDSLSGAMPYDEPRGNHWPGWDRAEASDRRNGVSPPARAEKQSEAVASGQIDTQRDTSVTCCTHPRRSPNQNDVEASHHLHTLTHAPIPSTHH